MSVRAKTVDVLTQVRAQLQLDAQAAAGNDVLSKAEQKKLDDADVLKASADDVRAQSSSVHVGPLVDAASSKIEALLGGVNTKTPAYVSQSEVKQLAGVNANAAVRVAKAFELITGKHIDLPSSTPAVAPPSPKPPKPPAQPPSQPGTLLPVTRTPPHVTPPASSSGALSLGGLAATSSSPMGLACAIVDNALELKGMAAVPGTFDVVIDGRPIHLDFVGAQQSAGGVGGAFDARDTIEALRNALPADLALRVAENHSGTFLVDFWRAGAVPAVENAPQYGMVYGDASGHAMMTGPLAVKCANGSVPVGASFAFRVDDKVYTATAETSAATVAALMRDLKAQMEADGRIVVVKDYGSMGMCSLRVTS